MSNLKEKQHHFLQTLQQKIDQLPMLPAVISRLMTLSVDDEKYFEKVLELAQEDPSISTRLIQIANSAANAPAHPITTIHHAIARIGARQINNLVTCMAVMKVFIPTTQGQKNLWIHAVQVAVGAKKFASYDRALSVDPDEAYLCGQLHDIGRFVMFENAPDELGRIDETNWNTPMELVEQERQLTGFDHAGLGWIACKKWQMPHLVTEFVKQHHHYSYSAHTIEQHHISDLLRVVQLADLLSVTLLLFPEWIDMPDNEFSDLLEQRCIHPSWDNTPVPIPVIKDMAPEINDEANQILSGLGIL